jgi:hypothetical protein
MDDQTLGVRMLGEDYYLKEKPGKENVVLEHELEKDQGPGLRSE